MLVFEIGSNWKQCLRRIQLDLNVGYEIDYWPTQILLAKVAPGQGKPAATGGNLFLTQQSTDVGFKGFNFSAALAVEF
jgi:hypothetical protein